jgi:ketosteroid isomerase-like protein
MTDDHAFVDSADSVVSGRDEVLDAWRGFFEAFPDYRNVWTRLVPSGQAIVAIGHSVCPTEPKLAGPAIWRATVHGDRVAEWRVYEDTPANRAELGLADARGGILPEVGTDQQRREVLKDVLEAFNRHDLDAIMSHFADDCVFESPRGPDPWGRRFVGKDEVREGLAARFEGIPDVHYGDDDHFACGNRGVSEWTISGTTVEGERIEVRGCDLWTFGDDGKLTRKDSFWKIR